MVWWSGCCVIILSVCDIIVPAFGPFTARKVTALPQPSFSNKKTRSASDTLGTRAKKSKVWKYFLNLHDF